ncbi:hypothetical protein BT69DRAFT_1246231, partial [Atractiella rhizophila]
MDLLGLSVGRQPHRKAWSRERLIQERATTLALAYDPATKEAYSSAARSYIQFCQLHKFSLTPSRDTLSFYIVYMSHFVKPSTVKSYLSGIASFIEPYFPEWPAIRRSRLVQLTLAGCFKRFQTPTNRKRPLMESDLIFLFGHLSDSYDDTLFKCIVAVGWHNLHRAGELVDPDEVSKRDFRNRIKRTSVNIADDTISYMLPAHKGDRTFMGNLCVLQKRDCETLDPTGILKQYLKRRDIEHPYNP